MSATALVVVELALAALVILAAGVRLARYGDVIAEKTGLGGTWIGVVGLAAVTSLPELVTGGSAVLLFDVGDIAAGDAIGSCMVNLVILALLDVRERTPLSTRIHQGHVLAAGFGILQLGLTGLALLAGPRAPVVGWVAVHSIVFVGLYLFAIRAIFVFERGRMAALAEELTGEIRYRRHTLRRAVVLYAANALALVAAATALPGLAARLAALTGLAQGFVGSLFVAVATSLPEMVVSAAALRLGAVDMAVANLFGSNLFNIAVLGIDDVLYTRGSLLAAVSASHLVTVIGAMTMTAMAIVGVTFRAQRKRYWLSWDAFGLVAVYVVSMLLLHAIGA